MTARIHRGFHRIGVVLAAPPLLVGVVAAGYQSWLQWGAQPSSTSDIDDAFWRRWNVDPAAMRHVQVADYTGPLIAIAMALVLYAVARAVGWVLARFLEAVDQP